MNLNMFAKGLFTWLCILGLTIHGEAWGQPPASVATIQGIVQLSDGTRITGSAKISWDAFTSSDGSKIGKAEVTVEITQGILSVRLVPNERASPQGAVYHVTYSTGSSKISEQWVVPAISQLAIDEVRVGAATVAEDRQVEAVQSFGLAAGGAYETVQNSGAALTQRTVLNFSQGLAATDDSAGLRTNVAPVYGATAGTLVQGNDSRLSDARQPVTHKTTHHAGGSDELDPVLLGAVKRTNDFMRGTSATQPVLLLQGAIAQAASLQEWRNGSGELVAAVTPSGSAFFREAGLAAKIGQSSVSQFFQTDGLSRFALSSTSGSFDIVRYNDGGVFKDRVFRISRYGNININARLNIGESSAVEERMEIAGPWMDLPATSVPADPASGKVRIFFDDQTDQLSVQKSTGTTASLEGGAGGGGGGLGGRYVSTGAPFNGECVIWNDITSYWEPGPCSVVRDRLTWTILGAPTVGVYPITLTVPEDVAGLYLRNVRVVANSPGSTSTAYNIERCVANCSTSLAEFTSIYSSGLTLGPTLRTDLHGEPDSPVVDPGEQFRVRFLSVGAGLANVTVSLEFEYQAYGALEGQSPLNCDSYCAELWDVAGLEQRPFGPPRREGDSCVCFGPELPRRIG